MAIRARLLTKTQLKAERLKPAKGQLPATHYWQGRGWVDLYDPGAAALLRAYRPPTATQLANLSAGRQVVGTAACATCGVRVDKRSLNRGDVCDTCRTVALDLDLMACHAAACAQAAQLLARDPLFLDTETTGLDDDAEIIEIAVLDEHGNVLLESLVRSVALKAVIVDANAISRGCVPLVGNDGSLALAALERAVFTKSNSIVSWPTLRSSAAIFTAHSAMVLAALPKRASFGRWLTVSPLFRTIALLPQILRIAAGGQR